MFHKRSRFIAQWLLILVTVTAVFLSGAASVNAAVASWSIVTSPNTSASENNYLADVACVSSSDCWAVGYYMSGSYYQTLVEQYNGTSWIIVTSPSTSASENNYFSSVTCATTSFCMAVGRYNNGSYDQTLVEEWNGTSWSIVTSPNTSTTQTNDLYGVSCTSATSCMAVGRYNNGSYDQTLVEEWNGTSWSIVTSPNTSTTENNEVFGVACVSASDCWAVGHAMDAGGYWQTLIEQWNGSTWAIVSSPDTSTTENNALYAVTCVSSSDCWAMNYSYNSSTGHYQGLAEEWNGTSWTIVSSPNTDTTGDSYFNSVACVSASECVLVGIGTYVSGGPWQTLVEEWNGTSWSIVASPNTSTTLRNQLNGVACASASYCIGVGTAANSSGTLQTLVEQTSVGLAATVPVVAGTLSFVTPPANLGFSTVTLTGSNQTAAATETLDIGDNTGSGSGWDVTVSNTPFTNGTQTLPNSDFVAALPPTPVCDSGVTCTPATWSGSVGYPYTLPGSTGTKLLSAAATTGMANQTVTIAWSASIPANTYAGTYTSTWTLTLASGP